VLIAHRPNPANCPQRPRLAALLAGVEGFHFDGLDALQDGVRPMRMADVEPQAAEFLFDLQDFERLPGLTALNVTRPGSIFLSLRSELVPNRRQQQACCIDGGGGICV
jgi:hypothetical protein